MDALRAQLIKSMLQIQRFTSEEIEKLGDLSDISNEELGERIDKVLRERTDKKLGLNGNNQKIIPMGVKTN